MKKRYVLKKKKRFITIVLTLSLIIFSSVFMASVQGFKERAFETITVKSGDTLWDIALEFNKKGDIRKYIHEIKELNGLSESLIYSGDELKLPQYD